MTSNFVSVIFWKLARSLNFSICSLIEMNQIEYFHNAKFGYMAELSFNGNWLKNGYCSITETPQKLAKKKSI